MKQCYRNKQHRRLSQEAEDASAEGMVMSTMGSNSRPIMERESLMASVVKAASVFNNLLIENCGMCTVYCDKQVQYEEYVQQQYDVSTGALGHLYSQLNPTTATATATTATATTNTAAVGMNNGDNDNNDNDNDVDNSNFINHNEMNTPPNSERIQVERYYREFLFDEESVVRSVGSRGAVDDED